MNYTMIHELRCNGDRNGLTDVVRKLIEYYNIDISRYDNDDPKTHDLITVLKNDGDLSFTNFCVLLNILGLTTSIKVLGDPGRYPANCNEVYHFNVFLSPIYKPIYLEVNDTDDVLVKFIKTNINCRNMTTNYFEGRVSEMELKNLMMILQKGTMSIKVFEKFCNILEIDPVITNLIHANDVIDAKK